MKSARVVAVSLLLAVSVPARVAAAPRTADPLAAFMGRVAAAVQSDDLSAFEPLVTKDFDWGNTSILPLVTNYKCPEVTRWSFTPLERSDVSARVRLELEAVAIRVGRGTPAPLPRFWILDLSAVSGRWSIGAFSRLERDIASRIVRARPEERGAIFAADPDADPHVLIPELADVTVVELPGLIRRRYNGKPPADAELAEVYALRQFARGEARRLDSAADESIDLSLTAAFLRARGLRAEALAGAEEAVELAYRSGAADAMAAALLSRGLGR